MKRIISALAIILTVAVLLWPAQQSISSPSVMTDPVMRFWDSTGKNLLTGGKVYTYEAGSSTPKATYTDSTGLVQNANPVVLNSRGEANIWLDGCYKIVLKNSAGVTQWTVDNVCSISEFIAAVLSAQNEWVDQSDVLTYLSATSFSTTGDRRSTYEVGRRFKATTSSGYVYGYVLTSSYAAGVTTVTAVLDSGNFTGISDISVGILSVTNASIPALPTIEKTSGFTISGKEVNRTIVTNFTSTGLVTLGSATSFPPGTRLHIVSTGTGSVTLSGVVSNGLVTLTNPVLYQGDEAHLVSESTSTVWRGAIVSTTPATGRIPKSAATSTLNAWIGWPDKYYVISQITSSGTWTVPANIDEVFFFASGGGGAGGTGDINGGGGGGGEGRKLWWHRATVVSGATYSVIIGAGGAPTGAAGAGGSGSATSIVLASDPTATVFSAGGGGGGYSGATGAVGSYGLLSYASATFYKLTPDLSANSENAAVSGTAGAGGAGGRGQGRQSGSGGASGAGNPGQAATAGSGSGGGGGGYSAAAVNSGGAGAGGYLYYFYLRKPE